MPLETHTVTANDYAHPPHADRELRLLAFRADDEAAPIGAQFEIEGRAGTFELRLEPVGELPEDDLSEPLHRFSVNWIDHTGGSHAVCEGRIESTQPPVAHASDGWSGWVHSATSSDPREVIRAAVIAAGHTILRRRR